MTPNDAALLARGGAIWVRRPDVRTLELTGPDRARYLNGQVTNDVAKLRPGEGTMAVKTSAKGRCEAFVRVRATEDALFVDVREVVAAQTLAALERYIIMDDCTIRDVSAERVVCTLLGVRPIGAPELPPFGFAEVGGAIVIRDDSFGVEGYELHAAQLPLLDTPEAPLEALEILRIEAGVPVDGRELGPDVIPLEAHLDYAISTTKGCYSGQEVIARATNLGGVQWSLVSLDIVEGPVPAVGAELFADTEKSQGSITSAVFSPRANRPVALAFVRRAHQAPGTRLSIAGGGVCVVAR